MFVDQVTIHVEAGDGGAGSASLRSEPYTPRGGPDGGDGGKGGDVILRVDPAMFDLAPYADRPKYRAKGGGPGGKNNRTGGEGEDLILFVPDGTVVTQDGTAVADLVGAGTSVVVARGGRGGRGNASLASARNRVPRVAERGEPGDRADLALELRLVADVGLVGLPNAGKSTLLSRLTAARPKIADYPFTTLAPNLGVAGNDERYVVADVPGVIEGAHRGKGLGLAFLRHVSRCRVLVYVVDLTADPLRDLVTVRAEVEAFDPAITRRRSLVVGTKSDLLPEAARVPAQIDLAVSGVTGEGIEELSRRIGEVVTEARAQEPPPETYVVLRPGRETFVVSREGARFRVAGPRVERWVAEADLEDARQVVDLQRRLVRAGVERRLQDAGAQRGDEVVIGGTIFQFLPEEDHRVRGPGEATMMAAAMGTKRELMRAEDIGWSELIGLAESLTPAEMEQPGYFPEGWSVKDLLAHIGSWQAEAGQILEQIRVGTYQGRPVDVEVMNEEFYEANKELPLPVVRAEAWAARNRMLSEWNDLPEITLDAEEWFVESGPQHYEEHLPRLREWVRELHAA